MYLLRALATRGLVHPMNLSQYSDRIGLSFEGWRRYEELKRKRVDSRLAFMAMPFRDARLDSVFAAFGPAVEQTGFALRRIDYAPPAGLVDNRLRTEIRKSRFMVCELTDGNAGAYWEGGFAEGLGRPVIYSCEKT